MAVTQQPAWVTSGGVPYLDKEDAKKADKAARVERCDALWSLWNDSTSGGIGGFVIDYWDEIKAIMEDAT